MRVARRRVDGVQAGVAGRPVVRIMFGINRASTGSFDQVRLSDRVRGDMTPPVIDKSQLRRAPAETN